MPGQRSFFLLWHMQQPFRYANNGMTCHCQVSDFRCAVSETSTSVHTPTPAIQDSVLQLRSALHTAAQGVRLLSLPGLRQRQQSCVRPVHAHRIGPYATATCLGMATPVTFCTPPRCGRPGCGGLSSLHTSPVCWPCNRAGSPPGQLWASPGQGLCHTLHASCTGPMTAGALCAERRIHTVRSLLHAKFGCMGHHHTVH